MKPAKHKFTLLKQVVETIPAYLVSQLARKHGVDKRSRSFSPWGHVVAMFFPPIIALHEPQRCLRYAPPLRPRVH